jgi:HTH-type transcriptional regulator / antitoxin MqsA
MLRKCFNCDSHRAMTRFEGETFEIEYAGNKAKVDGLSSWRCENCGEVVFDAASAKRYGRVARISCPEPSLILGNKIR